MLTARHGGWLGTRGFGPAADEVVVSRGRRSVLRSPHRPPWSRGRLRRPTRLGVSTYEEIPRFGRRYGWQPVMPSLGADVRRIAVLRAASSAERFAGAALK